MIIFIHPSPKFLFRRNLYAGGISLAPKIWITGISLPKKLYNKRDF